MYWSFGPNRYICTVLDEMRKCYETHNYSVLLSLVEEAQILANRMEAALSDYKDYEEMIKRKAELKKQLRQLSEEVDGKTKE